MIQRRFYCCIVSADAVGGRYVVKLPRGDDVFSCELLGTLKDRENLERYRRVLTSLQEDPWLAKHTVKVWGIRHDGGYTSEFVDGINLAQYRDELLVSDPLPLHERRDLIHALGDLLNNLAGYFREHGRIIGDWPLHNLVFSRDQRAVINVDAEGFFTYDGSSPENHWQFIKGNLTGLSELLTLLDSKRAEDAKVLDVFRVLDEVRRSGEQYSATMFVAGYHSVDLEGRRFRGQRECSERLAKIPYDFANRVVVDLGCNVGGMLHALAKTIKKGYGFDFNSNCVNAAQLIKALNRTNNLEFYTFDLDRQDLPMLSSFLLGERVDICLLLAVCRWLARWREVVRTAAAMAESMLFETNGSADEQAAQVVLLRECYAELTCVGEESTDDYSLGSRKFYLLRGPLLAPTTGPRRRRENRLIPVQPRGSEYRRDLAGWGKSSDCPPL